MAESRDWKTDRRNLNSKGIVLFLFLRLEFIFYISPFTNKIHYKSYKFLKIEKILMILAVQGPTIIKKL